MTATYPAFSLDHRALLDSLVASDRWLIIQDLDGVCMGLVRDPLTRRLERRYIEAAACLAGHFQVLTNGEHIGRRGVNRLVERALDSPSLAGEQGLYLPGLAAGGVQLQDRHGQVSHPGVSAAELAFLQTVPGRGAAFLTELLSAPPYSLKAAEIARLIDASVLDNPASPTLNLNSFFPHFAAQPGLYRLLQQAVEGFMAQLLQAATDAGLSEAFFVHLAPNLGRDAQERERLSHGDADNPGTTDFQFMLKGAIKEVGVLVILNHYYHQHTGHYPLGEGFNARQAPRDPGALLELARKHFDPALMPRILGVGDTVSSCTRTLAGHSEQLRGGSDRGFLTLVQALGEAFDTGNTLVYVDSSAGEVERPRLDAAHLLRRAADPTLPPWPAALGISDRADPLRLDVVFCEGHRQYVAFFCALAERHGRRND